MLHISSKSYNSAIVLRVLLLGSAAACGDPVAPPVDLVVPVQIVAEPNVDTIGLADSVRLTVYAPGEVPTAVQWITGASFGDPDTVVGDTLVVTARYAGDLIVRATASFGGGRGGSATRTFATPAGIVPPLVVAGPDGISQARVPLGDSMVFIARYQDSVAPATAPVHVQWFLESTVFETGVLVGTGDTLRFPVDTARTFWFRTEVVAATGARSTRRFSASGYDPITPALWRRPVPRPGGAGTLTWDPAGRIITHAGGTPGDTGYIVAFTPTAEIWRSKSHLGFRRIMVTGDGGVVLHAGGAINRFGADGARSWVASPAATMAVERADGVLIAAAPGLLRALSPTGAEVWRAALDPVAFAYPRDMAVASDGTVYLVAIPTFRSTPPAIGRVAAFDPDGAMLWERPLVSNFDGAVAIAEDGTVIVQSDSIQGFSPDGTRRWSDVHRGFSTDGTQPVAAFGMVFEQGLDGVLARSLSDGSIIWTGGRWSCAIATADGTVLMLNSFTVVAVDAATGAERWRHVTAGGLLDLLLRPDGLLLMTDGTGMVEALQLPAGPAVGWPMAGGGPSRRGRAQ